MSRIVSITLVLMSAALIAGCLPPDAAKDDARFRMDPAEAAMAEEGFTIPGAAEVDLVEQMITYRSMYQAALAQLLDYYKTGGHAEKLRWATRETESLVQYRYLMPAEAMQTELAATDSIEAADVLFEESRRLYWEAKRLVVIADEDKFRTALRGCNKVIT